MVNDAMPDDDDALRAAMRAGFRALRGSETPSAGERYVLGDEVGRGGIGVVMHARDRQLERDIAIKFLREDHGRDEDSKRRFLHEARMAGNLQHPGIAPLYDVGDFRGKPFFTMRLIDGASLADMLTASRHRLLAIFESVCQAVAYAHAHGVVHRDLKPQNVMVGSFGEVQVVDWGASAVIGEVDAGGIVGTPAYMPPEHARPGRGVVDPRADVFGLGAILFAILTGRPPYEGSAQTAIRSAASADSAEIAAAAEASGASPDWIELARACLSEDPAQRPADASAVADSVAALREAEARAAETARTRLAEERGRAHAQRQRHRLVLALLAISVLALGSIYVLWHSAERNLDRFHLLANVEQLRNAIDEAADLHPAWPENQPSIAGWIERAEALLDRLPTIVAARDAPMAPETRGDEAFLHRTLTQLVSDLEFFRATTLVTMRENHDWARSIEARSITRILPSWRAAAERLARDPRFEGLRLDAQIGLLPLAADPDSKLEEFLHLRSHEGEVPTRDARGALELGASAGIVFVLVPGPLFVAKHELTQHQWTRLADGTNPSFYRAGRRDPSGTLVTGRHPVEHVTWADAVAILERHALRPLRESEWEFACRAGTSTPWSSGATARSLAGYANLADVTAKRVIPQWRCESFVEDSFVAHAPVGSFRPNAFGLHDMHGNVAEWCLGPDDAVSDQRFTRGGSCGERAEAMRSDFRAPFHRDFRAWAIGTRAAREVLPRSRTALGAGNESSDR